MVRDHNSASVWVPVYTMASADPLQRKPISGTSGHKLARRDRTAEHLLAADDHGRSWYDNGSVLRIIGDGIAGVDQILYVKLGGFADVRQRLFGRVPPGVAAFQGRTERVVGRGAVFKTVFLDDDAKHVGLHDFIIVQPLDDGRPCSVGR